MTDTELLAEAADLRRRSDELLAEYRRLDARLEALTATAALLAHCVHCGAYGLTWLTGPQERSCRECRDGKLAAALALP